MGRLDTFGKMVVEVQVIARTRLGASYSHALLSPQRKRQGKGCQGEEKGKESKDGKVDQEKQCFCRDKVNHATGECGKKARDGEQRRQASAGETQKSLSTTGQNPLVQTALQVQATQGQHVSSGITPLRVPTLPTRFQEEWTAEDPGHRLYSLQESGRYDDSPVAGEESMWVTTVRSVLPPQHGSRVVPMYGLDFFRALSNTCNCGFMLAPVTHDSIINSAMIAYDSFLCGLQGSSTDEEPIVQSEGSSEWQGDLSVQALLTSLRGSGLDSIMVVRR